MGFWERIKTAGAALAGGAAEPTELRYWDAAKTDRLNEAHWRNAGDGGINRQIELHGPTLRARMHFESWTNPRVRGVIRTHVTDIVGRTGGPVLQAHSEQDPEWAEAFEKVWKRWWKRPDVTGTLTGGELLAQIIHSFWKDGYAVLVKVNADPLPGKRPRREQGPRFRLWNVAPRRLGTPAALAGDVDVVMGIRRKKDGTPETYYILEEDQFGLQGGFLTGRGKPYPADQVIHLFEAEEAGQAQGVPWLASVLQTAADVRDYDAQTLDQARNGAEFSQWLQLRQDATPTKVEIIKGEIPLQRRTMKVAPAGYELKTADPPVPSSNYKEYRRERLADIGAPIGMPGMMVHLDSSGHNFSSARFDAKVYDKANACFEGVHLEEKLFNPCAFELAREAVLMQELPPMPKDLLLTWVWPVSPHINPMQEAKAEETRIANGTLTHNEACAAHGLDGDMVRRQLKKEIAQFEEMGVEGLEHPYLAKNKNRTAGEQGSPGSAENDSVGNGSDRDWLAGVV